MWYLKIIILTLTTYYSKSTIKNKYYDNEVKHTSKIRCQDKLE